VRITEVRVKIIEDRGDKLQAFCTITLDDSFVIRDLKIIEGAKGVFVAMPSRKLTDRCPKCSGKNHLRASFCNDCGHKLTGDRAARDDHGRAKLHADIAHPINSASREVVQRIVLDAYRSEIERSKQPGYVPTKLYDDEDYVEDFEEHPGQPAFGGRPPPDAKPAGSEAAPAVALAPAAARPGPTARPAAAPPAAGSPVRASEPKRAPSAPAPGTGSPTEDDFTRGIFG
jgi:stage V sporulation protein G